MPIVQRSSDFSRNTVFWYNRSHSPETFTRGRFRACSVPDAGASTRAIYRLFENVRVRGVTSRSENHTRNSDRNVDPSNRCGFSGTARHGTGAAGVSRKKRRTVFNLVIKFEYANIAHYSSIGRICTLTNISPPPTPLPKNRSRPCSRDFGKGTGVFLCALFTRAQHAYIPRISVGDPNGECTKRTRRSQGRPILPSNSFVWRRKTVAAYAIRARAR